MEDGLGKMFPFAYGTFGRHRNGGYPPDKTYPLFDSHFTLGEVACHHTGLLPPYQRMTGEAFRYLVELLEQIRGDSPLIVNSWYRSPEHPIEAAKKRPGPHTTGLAVDIRVSRQRAYSAVREATLQADLRGFKLGLGVSQKGTGRFLHIDFAGEVSEQFFRPTVWSY